MIANSKGTATNSPSKPKSFLITGGDKKRSGFSNYRYSARFGQSVKCSQCHSDYMKFSVNGFCQDCIQRVEYIVREFPHIARSARQEGVKV